MVVSQGPLHEGKCFVLCCGSRWNPTAALNSHGAAVNSLPGTGALKAVHSLPLGTKFMQLSLWVIAAWKCSTQASVSVKHIALTMLLPAQSVLEICWLFSLMQWDYYYIKTWKKMSSAALFLVVLSRTMNFQNLSNFLYLNPWAFTFFPPPVLSPVPGREWTAVWCLAACWAKPQLCVQITEYCFWTLIFL